MNQTSQIRVLIVEDHPVVRYGLVALIDSQPDMEVTMEAGSGEEALAVLKERRIDVAIVDLRLPAMSGVDLIRAARQLSSETRIVVLTTYDGDEDIFKAIAAGAQGYVIKAMSHDILLGAIRKTHAGGRYIPEVIARALAKRVRGDELTPREIEILQLIAKGLSNKDIAINSGITEGTVKCHVNVILDKLGASHRTQAVVIAIQRGFVHL